MGLFWTRGYRTVQTAHCAVHCRMQMCCCTERLNVACSTVLHFCPRSAPAKLKQWSLNCSALICTIHPAHETPDNGGTHQPVTDSHINALPHIRPMFAFPPLVSIMLRSFFRFPSISRRDLCHSLTDWFTEECFLKPPHLSLLA